MATKTEVNQKLEILNRRYTTDLGLYNNAHACILFFQNSWEPVPDSFWSIPGKESGVIMEKKIDSDYCLEMTDRIEIAKMNGYYRDTIFNMDELPDDVIDKVAGVLDETETIMERVDDKFLMEAEKNG